MEWSIPKEEVQNMKSWYEFWAKAGANPNYRIENQEIYLSGLNWLSHWYQEYFFTKVTDFLFIIFLICIVIFFSLKGEKKVEPKKINYSIFYFILILLFFEWFFNHPSLRYGGFTVIALILFVPLSGYLYKKYKPKKKIFQIVLFFIILSFSIYFLKNLNRIYKEVKKYNYKPLSKPHYHIIDNAYFFRDMILSAQKIDKDRSSFYLVITKDLIKKVNNQ